jgi:cell wall-associated NlpC family hydrolase
VCPLIRAPRAAPEQAPPRRGASRRLTQRLLTVAAVLCVALVPAAQAHAAPSVDEVEAQIDKQWEQLEPVIEQYNKVHGDLAANKKKTAALEQKIQPLALQTQMALNRVGSVAARYYMTGPSSNVNALLATGDPSTLADQLTILDRLARQERAQINSVIAAREKYDAEKQKIDALVVQQQKQDADLGAKKKHIDAEIKRLQQLRLTAYGSSTSGGALRIGACPAVYPGGAAGTAVKAACAQIGKPYVYNTDGPSTFDCSGLTLYAWGKAGVSLGHFTGSQWNSGKAVSRANARAGDLVFFFSDHHHVGMYVGNGLMVHAARAGKPVRMEHIDAMPIAGFRRVG